MERQEVIEIDSVEALDLINDPIRMRLLHLFGKPRTVRDVAEQLGVPITRLYYHVNLLEEHGFLVVVRTEKVGAMVTRYFMTAAKNFRPGSGLLETVFDSRKAAEITVASVLDGARLDAETALEAHFRSPNNEPTGLLGRFLFPCTIEQANALSRKVEKLIADLQKEVEDMDAETDGTELFSFTYALMPAAGPVIST